jgi:hypothetical protein
VPKPKPLLSSTRTCRLSCVDDLARGLQVEARLRQLEGREHEVEAVTRTPSGPAKYDSMKAEGGLMEATPATYNTDADIVMKTETQETNGEAKAGKVRPLMQVKI